jgi:hypothetical protein
MLVYQRVNHSQPQYYWDERQVQGVKQYLSSRPPDREAGNSRWAENLCPSLGGASEQVVVSLRFGGSIMFGCVLKWCKMVYTNKMVIWWGN